MMDARDFTTTSCGAASFFCPVKPGKSSHSLRAVRDLDN
jgi:hypothetical protein